MQSGKPKTRSVARPPPRGALARALDITIPPNPNLLS
jgi:hypothetical protein